MNILFDNLESLIDASNGIEKARELILQLAIQGKVVKQDPKDEPASELLKKIKKEKEKLFTEGKIKKQNELPPIKDDEKPFELPKGWKFERLGNIAELINGITYSKSDSSDIPTDGYLPILRANNIKGKINFDGLVYVPIKNVSTNQLLKKFDNVIAMSSGSKSLVGKSAQLSEDFVGSFGAFCGVLRCYAEFNPGFINYFLQSPYYRDGISESSQGIGINNLRKENLLHLIIPTPPDEEQKRIVVKVNSLMALLDEIEEKRERRNQKRIKLNNASLDKLLTSKDDKEQKINWKRIEENFSTLYSVPENVEKLKQAILQLAVQGKLVNQDPEDEPASELLKKIKKEKEKLFTEGKIKKQNELPPIKDVEKPFELPNGWEWVRLGEITEIRGGKRLPKGEGLTRDNTGFIYIRVTDMKNGTIEDSDLHYITKPAYEIIKRYVIAKDDIYMTIVGATIGKCGLVPEKFHNMNLTENAVSVTPILINKVFLYLYLTSEFAQSQFIEKTKKVGVDKMAIYKFKNSTLPIPPVNEQKRIVEKVNELMSLCNALEEKLTKKEATAERLVGAVVNAVANKTNKPKDEKADKKKMSRELIEEIIKQHPKALKKLS